MLPLEHSMAEITHRTIKTNGINLHIAEAGDGPVVLLLHGWPESWYSWRHQLPALAAAGYHAIAPDVRGYGQSDKPEAIEAYSMKIMLADYLGILDAVGANTAVVVGHDWGAPMAWDSAALHPDRYRAVVGMSVPYLPRSPMAPIPLLKAAFGDNWFYILYFQEPGVAEAEFEADIPKTMRMILAGIPGFDSAAQALAAKKKGDAFLTGAHVPDKLPDWLTEADVAFFADEFKRSGFRGGLNRYRNMDRDWEELPELATAKIEQPALFITGEIDPVRAFAPTDGMKLMVPGLRDMLIIPGAGHWVQQEKAAEVNAALIAFLKELPA
jgi:pimeloyl-ACP methyl ester carboxylesterase